MVKFFIRLFCPKAWPQVRFSGARLEKERVVRARQRRRVPVQRVPGPPQCLVCLANVHWRVLMGRGTQQPQVASGRWSAAVEELVRGSRV